MEPFVCLFEDPEITIGSSGRRNYLTSELSAIYGSGLSFPSGGAGRRPYVISNFVTSIDGVASYSIPGLASGGKVSGGCRADPFLMGLLRACSDAVIVGSGTIAGEGGSAMTPDSVYPPGATLYGALRRSLGKSSSPLNVILTGSADLDLSYPIYQSPGIDVLLFTTDEAAPELEKRTGALTTVTVIPMGKGPDIDPAQVLGTLAGRWGVELCLEEGGPRVWGSFLGQGLIDELFITWSPRIAGRNAENRRPGIEEMVAFGPETSPQARLMSLRKHGNHLFSRYFF